MFSPSTVLGVKRALAQQRAGVAGQWQGRWQGQWQNGQEGSPGDFSLLPHPPSTPPPTSPAIQALSLGRDSRRMVGAQVSEPKALPPHSPPHAHVSEPGLSAVCRPRPRPFPEKGASAQHKVPRLPRGIHGSLQEAPLLCPQQFLTSWNRDPALRWLRGKGQPPEQGPGDQPAPLLSVLSSRLSRSSKAVVSSRDWELNS